jgi:hypothetical protein
MSEGADSMAYMYVGPPPSPVEPGDLLMRQKFSGLGWHYATGLSNGLVKDVTPEAGKHITNWEGFCAGKQGFIVRAPRSPFEKAIVEQRALSNMFGPYGLLADNCEHDANFAQTGVAASPTINFIGWTGAVGGGLWLLSELLAPKKRRRGRR